MRYSLTLFLLISLFSCSENTSTETLPILGNKMFDKETNQETNHKISPFSFTNQENKEITEDYLKNKITVVDFFFTSCPTICPKMTKNMLRVQQKWIENETVQFLSHTVDPKTDTPIKLKRFAEHLEINTKNWHFVTGVKAKLYEAGIHSYLLPSQEDAESPGGFLHSEFFILVDGELHLRGIYDGTKGKEMKKLNKDIKLLLNENK